MTSGESCSTSDVNRVTTSDGEMLFDLRKTCESTEVSRRSSFRSRLFVVKARVKIDRAESLESSESIPSLDVLGERNGHGLSFVR
jgi:hypothetical protein